MAEFFADLDRSMSGEEYRIVCGGPSYGDDGSEEIVNSWISHKLNVEVLVYRRLPERRAFCVKVPRPPDGSMDRLRLWLMTMGASDAWDLDAEAKAMEKLADTIGGRQMRQYLLTGSFLETSKRSGLTYFFRRLRPTVAMSPRYPWFRSRQSDSMRVLAVLCMHPVGYYHDSWAGCMVPTDDILAHLTMMRGDEAMFWRQANQHEAWRPEAGL